jgi:hypothetical protein
MGIVSWRTCTILLFVINFPAVVYQFPALCFYGGYIVLIEMLFDILLTHNRIAQLEKHFTRIKARLTSKMLNYLGISFEFNQTRRPRVENCSA